MRTRWHTAQRRASRSFATSRRTATTLPSIPVNAHIALTSTAATMSEPRAVARKPIRKTNQEREKARDGEAVAPQGNGANGIVHHDIVGHDGATFASATHAFRGKRWRTGPRYRAPSPRMTTRTVASRMWKSRNKLCS
jgi:hypothetical protein